MNPKKLDVSDEGNESFVPQSASLAEAKAGFDPGEQAAAAAAATATAVGQHRFPRRKSKEEIPQESLAERLRAKAAKAP